MILRAIWLNELSQPLTLTSLDRQYVRLQMTFRTTVIDGKWCMLDSTISEQKPSKMTENSEEIDQKPSNLTENVFPSMIVKNVYEAIKQNRKAKYSWHQDNHIMHSDLFAE